MYLPKLTKSAESSFFQYFPSRFTQKLRNLEMFPSILVKFCFLKSSQNSIQHSANLIFVAICGGFGPLWLQIDWTNVLHDYVTATETIILLSGSEVSLQDVCVSVCVSLAIYPVDGNVLKNAHEIKHMVQNTCMLMVETTTAYYTSL